MRAAVFYELSHKEKKSIVPFLRSRMENKPKVWAFPKQGPIQRGKRHRDKFEGILSECFVPLPLGYRTVVGLSPGPSSPSPLPIVWPYGLPWDP
jgi:hypothetical protein